MYVQQETSEELPAGVLTSLVMLLSSSHKDAQAAGARVICSLATQGSPQNLEALLATRMCKTVLLQVLGLQHAAG